MHICLATVTLYLCRYICVPRQAVSELLCNKDTQKIAGKCFILGSAVKDICSCKIVWDIHLEGITQTVQKKNKYTVEVLLEKI